MTKKIITIITFLLLSGCIETVVVATVATGFYVASDENITLFEKDKDSRIKSIIEKSFKIENNQKEYKNIDVKVYNGKVMLTGYVKDDKYKKIAVNKANSILDKTTSIDEILVIKNGTTTSIKDSMISSQISLKLKFSDTINSDNYRYNVVNGIVYILGEVKNVKESTETTQLISKIKGVEKVISYIIVS